MHVNVTLASGKRLLWEQIDTGSAATRLISEAAKFVAAVNAAGQAGVPQP